MNIDEMEAGPELDQLIAKEVMKWKRHKWPEPEGKGDHVRCTECGAYFMSAGIEWHTEFCYLQFPEVPKFSTDIAAACLALDAHRADWLWQFLETDSGLVISVLAGRPLTDKEKEIRPHDTRFHLGKVQVFSDWNIEKTRAQDYALAICRAALRAVAIDKT